MRAVLDASAVLAVVLSEDGAAGVTPYLGVSVISTLNLAEVLSRLAYLGVPVAAGAMMVDHFNLESVALNAAHAREIARLRPPTARAGLSVGDRASIVLAKEMDLPVVTADRVWAELDLDVEIVTIR